MTNIHPGMARALLEQFPAGVALTDKDDRVVWLNDAFVNMLELPEDDIIGQFVQNLPLPRLGDEIDSNFRQHSDRHEIAVKDRLVMIAQALETKQHDGKILMLVNRGHALVSFLNALSTGNVSAVGENGILTNAALRHRLEIEISRSRRYMNPLSCIVIRFNERIKNRSISMHEVQREIASMLKTQLRWVDVLGEWDKSSLVVLLPETNEIAATILSSKLEKLIDTRWSLEKAFLPIHWGVSSWRKGDDINRLVKRADNRRSKHLDAQ